MAIKALEGGRYKVDVKTAGQIGKTSPAHI